MKYCISVNGQHRPGVRGYRYDMLSDIGRHRRIYISSKSEDNELQQYDRLSISSQNRDLIRNVSIAGFALRKHCQFMAEFRFSCDTEDQVFNTAVEQAFQDWAMDPERCHSARRHNFWELLRIIETRRVLDGDVGIIRLNNLSLQIVESDRIRDEYPNKESDIIHGVRIGSWGQNIAYKIYNRRPGFSDGYVFDRWIPAKNMDLVGYFDSSDQVRGVSPLTPVVRNMFHIYDCNEYVLQKMLKEQMLFLKTKRDKFNEDTMGTMSIDDYKKVVSNFGRGSTLLDLGLQEDAEILSGDTPSVNFTQYLEMAIRQSFAALDIPYSFFDGSKTNFYGSKGELNTYINGCKQRQRGLLTLLHRITRWLLVAWYLDGTLDFPAGIDPWNVRFKWVGASIPTWRLIDDSKGYQIAIMNGLTNQEKVCEEHGLDFYDNLDRIAYGMSRARDKGIVLPFDPQFGSNNIGL